jgi:hypothetical protein
MTAREFLNQLWKDIAPKLLDYSKTVIFSAIAACSYAIGDLLVSDQAMSNRELTIAFTCTFIGFLSATLVRPSK